MEEKTKGQDFTNVPIAVNESRLDILDWRTGPLPQLLDQIHVLGSGRFSTESSREDAKLAL